MTSSADPSRLFDDSRLLCAIPVYNNATTIVDVAARCREQVTRVLVIDDGSTDADLRDLLKLLDVVVIRHPQNQGKGAALLTAFSYAAERDMQYVMTLDGDGQHFPEDIPRFVPRLSVDTLLIGYRDQVSGDMPASSHFGREFSDFWIYLETGRCACDTQSGFRVYPLAAVKQLRLDSRFYNFEMEIVTKALWGGIRTGSVDIRVWYPPAADRISSFHPFRDNFRISLLHLRLVLRQLLPIRHHRILIDCDDNNDRLKGANSHRDHLPLVHAGSVVGGSSSNTTNVGTNRQPTLPAIYPGSRASAAKSRSTDRSVAKWSNAILRENSGPLGLAVVTAASVMMTLVLWPWGFVPVMYLSIRLHLNKVVAFAWILILSAPVIHGWCARVGREIIPSRSHEVLAWVVGSHVVGIPLATIATSVVYRCARRLKTGASAPEQSGNEIPTPRKSAISE